MKLKSLAIAFCTLGLIASVPAVKMAIAQAEQAEQAEPEISAEAAEKLKQLEACDRVLEQEANVMFEGRTGFDDLKGINLTDEQSKTYDALSAQAEAKTEEIYKNSVVVVDPAAILSFIWFVPDVDSVPQEVKTAIQTALNKNPKFDQKAALDQEFGQYGQFNASYLNYITPEQNAQLKQITEDFHVQVQGIITPEQLPQ
ncbi:MAG: hypothetical protein HC824_09075 [Synechococcales cyanobacterium RM1_1_8]|nr:hypothetical protein [Synechococcales cyanobacterium RM1_1_8]